MMHVLQLCQGSVAGFSSGLCACVCVCVCVCVCDAKRVALVSGL
jgi:hypothetical protein